MDTIETKTYYGEYTLEHWIKMLLDQDLVLPEYQRSFQWKPEHIQNFIASIKKNQFIPPITIGSYKRNGERKNFIIDGQQRLTALLLAKLGYYPKPGDFKTIKENIINENDDEEVDEEDRIEWTFEKLIEKKTKLSDLVEVCKKSPYNKLECDVDSEFFTSKYLGFAYIVPKEKDETKQLPYFASVFRNINFQGIALSAQESRMALYYWDTSVTNWFNPPVFNNIIHNQHKQVVKLDFVRYASLLSQLLQTNNADEVFKGKSLTAESYYVRYIDSVTKDDNDSLFGKFSEIFINKNYQTDMDRLGSIMRSLGYADISFDNIVKLDVYLFGLIYYVVLKHKEATLSADQTQTLKEQLDKKIKGYTKKHKDSPANKEFIRMRIKDSIKAFGTYFSE